MVISPTIALRTVQRALGALEGVLALLGSQVNGVDEAPGEPRHGDADEGRQDPVQVRQARPHPHEPEHRQAVGARWPRPPNVDQRRRQQRDRQHRQPALPGDLEQLVDTVERRQLRRGQRGDGEHEADHHECGRAVITTPNGEEERPARLRRRQDRDDVKEVERVFDDPVDER